MRILHLVSYSLYSGPLPPTHGLALAQRRLGHEVWLAYDTKRGAFNDFEEAAEPRLAADGLAPPLRLTLSAKSTPVEFWRDARTLRRLAPELDVLHVHLSHDHGLAALALPRHARAARVRTFHSDRSLARRLGQARVNRAADGWITRASAHRELLVSRFGIDAELVAVIPSGLDAGALSPPTPEERTQARRRFDLASTAFVVVHVALIAERGQRELVSALAMLPEGERPVALFVGRGEGEAELERHVDATGMRAWVRYAGYLLGSELRQAYAAADAAFLAQPGNDGSARAALEAMASGVPLVAVATGALAELVSADRGRPLPSRHPAAIAAALRALRTAPGEAAAGAARARAHVLAARTFAGEAERTLALYATARDSRRASRYGRASTGGAMSGKNRQDSTEQLIADAEALRAGGSEKRAPRTRHLVRDAEKLIGRQPMAPGVKPLMTAALVLAVIALGVAALFLVLA